MVHFWKTYLAGTDVWGDFRQAIRLLRKAPGLTLTATLSLAVGVGINVIIFSLIDQTSVHRQYLHEPDNLVQIEGDQPGGFAYLDRKDLVDQCPSIKDVAAYEFKTGTADYLEIPRSLNTLAVSPNYFTLLGLRPAAGRFFTEKDHPDQRNADTAVISYSLWEKDFGLDPGIIGKNILISGLSMTVVGVAPKGYFGGVSWAPLDLWCPADTWYRRMPKWLSSRTFIAFMMVARKQPGAGTPALNAQLDRSVRQLCQTFPDRLRCSRVSAVPLFREAGAEYYLAATASMILPGLVLLLACANVSGLLIARAETRTHEIAIRLALGSSRWRLVRQLLTESLLLSLLGSLAGFLLAAWTARSLPALLPPSVSSPIPDIHIDVRMALLSLGLALVNTLLFGLLPARQAARVSLTSWLNAANNTTSRGKQLTRQNVLVAGQLALSLVLLCVAGLFLQDLWRALGRDPVLQRRDMALMELNPSLYGLARGQYPAFMRDLRLKANAVAGVKQAVLTDSCPDEGGFGRKFRFYQTGDNPSQNAVGIQAARALVDEHFCALMGLRVVQGRQFLATDDAGHPPVVLINRACAQAVWTGRDPLGQWIRLEAPDGPLAQVVGVIDDSRWDTGETSLQPRLYVSIWQGSPVNFYLLADAVAAPRSLLMPLRQQLRLADERVRPASLQTLHQRVRSSYGFFGRQFLARIYGAFGLLGILLAAIGLHAVVAYAVNSRTREIGVRMALGATRQGIQMMVLARGFKLALTGAAVGFPLAFAAAQCVRGELVIQSTFNPTVYLLMAGSLVIVTLLSSCLPAWRAAKVDPMVALRQE